MWVVATSRGCANGATSLGPLGRVLRTAVDLAVRARDALWGALRTLQHRLAVDFIEDDFDLAATAGVDSRQPRIRQEVAARSVDLQMLHGEIPAFGALRSASRRRGSDTTCGTQERQGSQHEPAEHGIHRNSIHSEGANLRDTIKASMEPTVQKVTVHAACKQTRSLAIHRRRLDRSTWHPDSRRLRSRPRRLAGHFLQPRQGRASPPVCSDVSGQGQTTGCLHRHGHVRTRHANGPRVTHATRHFEASGASPSEPRGSECVLDSAQQMRRGQ